MEVEDQLEMEELMDVVDLMGVLQDQKNLQWKFRQPGTLCVTLGKEDRETMEMKFRKRIWWSWIIYGGGGSAGDGGTDGRGGSDGCVAATLIFALENREK